MYLQTYMLSLVSPWYERLGFEDDTAALYPERSAREQAIAWACKLGHQDCRVKAKRLFDNWLQHNNA